MKTFRTHSPLRTNFPDANAILHPSQWPKAHWSFLPSNKKAQRLWRKPRKSALEELAALGL